MRYYVAALSILAVLGLIAITEPWPESDRKTWPVGTDEGCTDEFCDCPEASAALLCQDFEDGESDCAVSKAYGSLNALGEIGYVVNAPDCADATSPLDGTYSYEAADDADEDSMMWWPLDAGGGTEICADDETCVWTALLNIPSDGGAGIENLVVMFGPLDAVCRVRYRGSTNTIRAMCDTGTAITATIANETTYKICMTYSVADDCTLAVDPEGGTWCAGALGESTIFDCEGGAHSSVTYIMWDDNVNNATVNFDNVMVVAE
jgi:hypothetical protein